MYASRHDKQQQHELVAEFEVSGLSQRAFADRKNRIKLGTFQSWLYMIRSAKGSPKFVEVVSAAKGRGGTAVRPAVAVAVGSARVEFEDPPTVECLAALVRALDGES